jgi:hypothetical protein
MNKYRVLEKGEVVNHGDEKYSPMYKMWHPVPEIEIGKIIGTVDTGILPHRRPLDALTVANARITELETALHDLYLAAANGLSDVAIDRYAEDEARRKLAAIFEAATRKEKTP